MLPLSRFSELQTARYRIAFERRQDRDRTAIAQRNRQVVKAALEIVGRSPSPPPLWDITPKLLAAGHSFTSETDAEVVVHLLEQEYEGDLVQAGLEVGALGERREGDPRRRRGGLRTETAQVEPDGLHPLHDLEATVL